MKEQLNKKLAILFFNIFLLCNIIIYPIQGIANTTSQVETKPIQFSLWGDYAFGFLKGFEQIPAGGRSGTTTEQQPTFSQLSINQHGLWEGGAEMQIKKYFQVLTSTQLLNMRSNTVLDQPLVTHSLYF